MKNTEKDIRSQLSIIHLDRLVHLCGYFTSDTCVNNGYGCNHPDNGESEAVKSSDAWYFVNSNKIMMALLRLKYGSYINALENKEEAGKWLSRAMYNRDHLKSIGVDMQGKCYSFSCPVAHEADLQDMKILDKSLYEEFKDEEYDPTWMGAEYMVVELTDDWELVVA